MQEKGSRKLIIELRELKSSAIQSQKKEAEGITPSRGYAPRLAHLIALWFSVETAPLRASVIISIIKYTRRHRPPISIYKA